MRVFLLEFGRTRVIATHIKEIQCPNEFRGIGDIVWVGEPVWTGDTHIGEYGGTYNSHFGNVTRVSWRSNLWESDEPWHLIWEGEQGIFQYEIYFERARLLRKEMSEVRVYG